MYYVPVLLLWLLFSKIYKQHFQKQQTLPTTYKSFRQKYKFFNYIENIIYYKIQGDQKTPS